MISVSSKYQIYEDIVKACEKQWCYVVRESYKSPSIGTGKGLVDIIHDFKNDR